MLKRILFGIMSADIRKRHFLRLTFQNQKLLSDWGNTVRVLFVVGNNTYDTRNDQLRVPVEDVITRELFSSSQSSIGIIKHMHFLLYAVLQKEDIFTIGDDDTFTNIPILCHISNHIANSYDYFYAGLMEWYNWRPATFQATGWGYGPISATYYGKLFHNCTANFKSDCVGPIPFFKGPMKLMSKSAAISLVKSDIFVRDFKLLHQRIIRHTNIFDDVYIGYLFSTLQKLTYIVISPELWLEKRNKIPYNQTDCNMLCAHRLPKKCWHNATFCRKSHLNIHTTKHKPFIREAKLNTNHKVSVLTIHNSSSNNKFVCTPSQSGFYAK